ncbi:MAG: MBL fold metallo-hydrolase [Candidatus Bathyarchaeia archaeon]
MRGQVCPSTPFLSFRIRLLGVRVIILGSGSNGGVPQWDCCCPNCEQARSDRVLCRTRSSIALTLDGDRYLLIDASPDLRRQLEDSGIYPSAASAGRYGRRSLVDSILLTHGHGDHCVGLFEFSTGKCFNIPVYGPRDLIGYLFGGDAGAGFFGSLGRLGVDYLNPVPLGEDEPLELLGGLIVRGFEVPHTERLGDGSYNPTRTYAYEVEFGGRRLIYAPDLGGIGGELLSRLEGLDVFILDGTFWWDDELGRVSGISKTSYELGHIPISDSVELLSGLGLGRVIYTHINHTNPLLSRGGSYASILRGRGFEVAYDGMVIEI